jgi:hypothetical protein
MEAYSVSELSLSFVSGGKTIAMDCFIPKSDPGQSRFPAIITLHGSGGGHDALAELPATGRARLCVYVPHYFDRTGTSKRRCLRCSSIFPCG